MSSHSDKRLIPQQAMMILNMCPPKNKALKNMNKKLMELKVGTDKYIVIGGD